MEERVLFILTDDNRAGRFYESKKHITGDDVRLYFKKPSEFYQYDPNKMVFVCDPFLVNGRKKSDAGNDIAPFLNDCWYPFFDKNLGDVLEQALEYNPYVVLLQEESSIQNTRILESLSDKFTEIVTVEGFDPDYDSLGDIITFSEVLDCMDSLYNPKLIKLTDYLNNQKGQASS